MDAPRDALELPEIDTRVGANLVSVETGTEEVALSLARTRARYAIATWCLLKEPEQQEVWPTVASWSPQPYLEHGLERRPFEPKWTGHSSMRGNFLREGAEYVMPDDEALRGPMRAIELLPERHSARALLSCAWSVYLVARVPNGLERTDHMMHTIAAREALTDPGPQGTNTAAERWKRLTRRLGIWTNLLELGYEQDDIDEAQRGTIDVRNFATHRAEAVAINFGFPEGSTLTTHRDKRVLSADDIALAFLAAHLPVIVTAVRDAARMLVRGAIQNDWDDTWFHDQFK